METFDDISSPSEGLEDGRSKRHQLVGDWCCGGVIAAMSGAHWGGLPGPGPDSPDPFLGALK